MCFYMYYFEAQNPVPLPMETWILIKLLLLCFLVQVILKEKLATKIQNDWNAEWGVTTEFMQFVQLTNKNELMDRKKYCLLRRQ